MTISKDIKLIEQSFARCCSSDGFFDKFYENFLSSDPRIKPLFINTNFNLQNMLLKAGLAHLILYAQGDEFGKAKVQSLAKSHSKNFLDIKPEYYKVWLSSLLNTVAAFDSEYSPELAQAWEGVLYMGINTMINDYNRIAP